MTAPASAASAALELLPMPAKSFGTAGTPINLHTNFYALKFASNQTHQYVVQIEPAADSRFLRNKILKSMVSYATFGAPLFDGTLLFSQKKFPDAYDEITVDGNKYQIAVKFTNMLNMANLPPSAAQLLNIVLRKCHRTMKLRPIGRNYFDPSLKQKIPSQKIEVWPGIFSSVLSIEAGVALNVDSCCKVVRDQTALELIELIRRRDVKGAKLEEMINDQLKGVIVMTSYNNRTYKVEKVDLSRTASFSFLSSSGKQITLVEYYKARYGIAIKDSKQPLIVAQQKSRPGEAEKSELLLIPELCRMTGLTDEMVADFHVMKEVGEITRVGPAEKLQKIEKYRTRLEEPECKQDLSQWNIQLAPEIMKLQGRVLNPETIYLKQKKEVAHKDRGDWSNLIRADELLASVEIKDKKWLLLVPERESALGDIFLSNLKKVSSSLKVRMGEPVICYLPNDRAESYEKALTDTLKPDFQFVAFIIPPKGKERYDRIKQMLLLKMPLPSQAVVTKTLAKEKTIVAICTKICQQIQAKLCGEIWRVDIPLKNTMMVGIDVYHDTVKKGTSVLAFCASYSENYSKYWSTVVFQKSGQEICNQLSECLRAALMEYKNKNKVFPERIIVYRDGVGTGQLNAVREVEIRSLMQLLATMPGNQPKLTYIIVTKRINTRFFTAKKENPPPGLIVDRGVTSTSNLDFFLVAQSVNQGTATPTHYLVLADASGLKADVLQQLTFKLCHMYYNWPGTVRVPAPCQYAHKLAFLIGESVHQAPHARIASNLYFL